MSRWPVLPLKGHIHEVSLRKGDTPCEVLSVTNSDGFVRSLDVFDKQVFSQDTTNYKLVRFNDLAYNPSRINVGSVARCQFPGGGAVSPMYVVVRCRESLMPQYLLHFLKSDIGKQHINHLCVGAVRFQLRFSDLEQIEMPIPLRSDQERIVRVLDEADQLRRLRVEADRRTADLIPALFHEMFGDLTANPVQPLSNVSEVVSGIAKGRQLNGRTTVIVPYLRVANVQAGYLDLSEIKTIEALPSEVEYLALRRDDVLLTEGGDFDKLGRGALWEHDLEDCIHQNHIFRVRPTKGVLDSVFFTAYLQSPKARDYFLRCAKRTTNLASINMTQLRNLPVPIPHIGRQSVFTACVAEVRAMEAEQTKGRHWLDDLFQSLLYRAFQGEL